MGSKRPLSPSFRVKDYILSADCPLKMNERLVALAVADRMGRSGVSWPGYADLTARTGIPRRTVVRCMEALCTGPNAIFTRRYVKGRGKKCYEYTLALPNSATAAQPQSAMVAPSSPSNSAKSETEKVPKRAPEKCHGGTRTLARNSPREFEEEPPRETRDGDPNTFSAFKDHAFETWRERFEREPAWGKAEFVVLAKIHKRAGDENARQAWSNYLDDSDRFYDGHNPKKLLADLDRFIGTGSNGEVNLGFARVPRTGWYREPSGSNKRIVLPGDGAARIAVYEPIGGECRVLFDGERRQAPARVWKELLPLCKPSNDPRWKD